MKGGGPGNELDSPDNLGAHTAFSSGDGTLRGKRQMAKEFQQKGRLLSDDVHPKLHRITGALYHSVALL